ncbi:dynein light chain Tctex-type protein 2B-like [Vespa velutina]|uniref:dynein light chain Tctex-type protein 2B-like n=1 Tax=Vespa velutina TaxID=202808 RepID=UPI001FB4997C|nr:dynein light chain Tctex-type protein 2B-like [Vespa velutina]
MLFTRRDSSATACRHNNISLDHPKKNKTERSNDFPENLKNLEVEILGAENSEVSEPVYRIRPHLYDKFKPLSAKEVIHNVLFDQLSTKTYNAQDAVQWTKDIADIIKEKIKELKFKRYKYIINVVLGEQHGAGIKMGTRCIWDAEADAYAFDSFINDTIFCVATVYAIYFY